ncbi:MAG: hypothetical protein KF896_15780 [Ignavibacteriae bacterium]|nr:hypothetical protein [Ignavibacteriota bacterium]
MKQNISDFGIGTAPRALFEFLEKWANRDWEGMSKITQITWRKNESHPIDWIQKWYSQKRLTSFKIKATYIDGLLARCIAELRFGILRKNVQFRIIKESDAYQPSQDGQWGVNPIFGLKAFKGDAQ